MKFLDLFAGIGGFRLGMEAAGHECVGFCEIDKFARESYKAIHDTKGEIEFHDITRVSDDAVRGIGAIDVICGGFPCQAFSIAGNRRGFEDTRGTLFFEIARFASILRPRYLFLENVKGLLNHDGGTTFATILRTLDELGYDVEWQVLNSKDFGVPQNRERVFIIGHLRGGRTRAIFPLGRDDEAVNTADIINVGNVNPSGSGMGGEVYSSQGLAPTLTTNKGEGQKIAIPVLTPDRPEKRQNGRRFKENGDPMFTLTTQDKHGVVVRNREPKIIQRAHGYNSGGEHAIAPTLTSNSYHENNHVKVYDFYNYSEKEVVGTLTAGGHQGNTKACTFGVSDGFRIRKLTPKECWRLQGFPDWAFERAQEVNSNSQLYKQAGNSVTVNVIKAIATHLR